MLTYRTFRNGDPPALAALWRACAREPGSGLPAAVPLISPELLEQYVFAKLYFDYTGLVLACGEGEVLGMAQAGFGPADDESRLSPELGTTCLIVTRPDGPRDEIAAGLLEQTESYLRWHGAKVVYGGAIRPLNAFYFGLYGGSEMPGVLESDAVAHRAYLARGYEEIDRTLVLRRDLATFEAPMERQQMQIRRQMVVEVVPDPPSRTWWEACVLGEFELTRFEVTPRGGGTALASATFRNMDLVPGVGPGRVMGLVDMVVDESMRRRGLAVFVLSEAFRQFARQGVQAIEAQAMQHNVAGLGLYRKLKFEQIGQGSVFRKPGG